MVTLATITLLMMICATSLYITSQNTQATTQTTSWQQSLSGAEAGVDVAMNALNKNTSAGWTNWYNVTGALPQTKPSPSGSPNASSTPGNGSYNYFTGTYALTGEASNSVTYWVTIDNGTLAPTPSPSPGLVANGRQGFRIRAVGVVGAPGPPRVSNQKLDNDLRKISLVFNRFSGGNISTPQATRRIEMIALPPNNWALQLGQKLTMSGAPGTSIDSFSSTYNQANYGTTAYGYLSGGNVVAYQANSNATVGIVNNNGSDLGNVALNGSISWASNTSTGGSGIAPKNTTGVTGTVTNSYNGTVTAAPTPNAAWAWNTSYSGGSNSATLQAGASGSTTYFKVNGDINLSGSNSLWVKQDASGGTQNVVIWVTGQFATSGSSYLKQDPSINLTVYVQGQINFSGGSFQNLGGSAADLTIYGIGGSGSQATLSGSSNFTGVIIAPNYAVKISGSGDLTGSINAQSLDMSGGSHLHYDEALAGPNGNNFSFASWFEDNSDPSRGIYY